MKTSFVLGAMTVAGLAAGSAFAGTLDDVKARGTLNCGVSTGLVGFAAPDAAGVWKGFDVDMLVAQIAHRAHDYGRALSGATGKLPDPGARQGILNHFLRHQTGIGIVPGTAQINGGVRRNPFNRGGTGRSTTK